MSNLDTVTKEAGSQHAQGNPPCERERARQQHGACLSSQQADHLLYHCGSLNLLVLTEHTHHL